MICFSNWTLKLSSYQTQMLDWCGCMVLVRNGQHCIWLIIDIVTSDGNRHNFWFIVCLSIYSWCRTHLLVWLMDCANWSHAQEFDYHLSDSVNVRCCYFWRFTAITSSLIVTVCQACFYYIHTQTKGTSSFGKRHNKTHTLCVRCGRSAYHIQKKRCASCGFPAARTRKCKSYQNWEHTRNYEDTLCKTQMTFTV